MLKVKVNNELIDWTEFKSKLKPGEDPAKGIQFTVEQPKKTTPTSINPSTFKRLVGNRSELAEMRAEWREFKRESVWLMNALFAAAGVGFCAFFVTYRFDYGVRIASASVTAILIFFVEVILYILLQ